MHTISVTLHVPGLPLASLTGDSDVRVGPDVMCDPAFLVTRNMEDFITWTDTSKIRAHIMEYNEEVRTYVWHVE